jgi:hypothetical protein
MASPMRSRDARATAIRDHQAKMNAMMRSFENYPTRGSQSLESAGKGNNHLGKRHDQQPSPLDTERLSIIAGKGMYGLE